MMNISAERLLDELQKLVRSRGFTKLAKDKDSLEIISLIFPQLKNIKKCDDCEKVESKCKCKKEDIKEVKNYLQTFCFNN